MPICNQSIDHLEIKLDLLLTSLDFCCSLPSLPQSQKSLLVFCVPATINVKYGSGSKTRIMGGFGIDNVNLRNSGCVKRAMSQMSDRKVARVPCEVKVAVIAQPFDVHCTMWEVIYDVGTKTRDTDVLWVVSVQALEKSFCLESFKTVHFICLITPNCALQTSL